MPTKQFLDDMASYLNSLLLRCQDEPELTGNEGCCATAAMHGRNWQGDLMIYGRSPNGWVVQVTKNDTCTEAVREGKIKEILSFSDGSACVCDKDPTMTDDNCDRDPMHWVHHLRRFRSKYDGTLGRRGRVATGFFWAAVGKVVGSYYGPDVQTRNFASRVAWSNLYKIAPWKGWNPTDSLKRVQFDASVEMLRCELNELRPKHVIFFTEKLAKDGHNGDAWFSRFREPLRVEGYRPTGDRLVLGTGCIGNSRFVLAVHPQGSGKAGLAAKVVEALRRVG
jgi:hypothetical protein